ncbi:UNVERIFIED_CONTAM: hypothetical protein FKN15_059250 [Acipenser sinensis]
MDPPPSFFKMVLNGTAVAAQPQEPEMLARESWDCATAGETTTENELANQCRGMYATQRPPRTRARLHGFTDFVTDFHTKSFIGGGRKCVCIFRDFTTVGKVRE